MRKPRYYYESNFYHIMVQGDEKKNIFKTDKNKKKMIYLLKHNAFRNDIEIVAYCIMDNHAHLLVFCPEIGRISKMMQQVNTSFGIYFTNKREKVGHVFRERFRSEPIYTKSHLLNCIKYIHNNPVKAKMCQSADKYHYSSYNNYYKLNERLKEICDLTRDDMNLIIKGEDTITRFLDDDYSKDDINYAFEESKKMFSNIIDIDEKISKQYMFLKENCKITDKQIADLLKMSRSTMYLKLKKTGKK